MRISHSRISAFLFLVLCLIYPFNNTIHAQLEVPGIFSNGTVLQRNIAIPVWGKAAANSSVSVTLAGISSETTADANGDWYVELSSREAGGPYALTIESGDDQVSISSVYIGDVWLASGQSNMELEVNSADSASAVVAAANDPKIRQFKIPKGLADEPSDELPSGSAWTPATSSYVGNFTAVGYFFARELRKHYDVPIGIINSSYGGSRIETWMSDEMLGYDESDTTLANGESERQPTVAYNKMIYPILKYAIKGIIWYQGESNGDSMEDALAYGELFKTHIQGWRELWGNEELPFIWVQLPNYGVAYDEPQSWDAWPQLRAGQSSALSLPYTGEAVTIDVGGTDIHPKYKQPVGYRLSLIARKLVYGEDIVYSGPRYKSNRLREDGKIEINYNYLGSGLMAQDSDGGEVYGFAVEDDNGNLEWADAVIDGDQVLVWNDDIPEPGIVRYAWEYNPADVNLYNEEGLPAAPFLDYVNPGFKIAKFEAASEVIEEGRSTTLTWLVFGASSIMLDGEPVDSSGSKVVTPDSTTIFTLIAENRENTEEKDTANVTVIVLDPGQINRALGGDVKASTFEACCGEELTPDLAVDGDFETRWSSAWQTGDGTTDPDPNLDDDPDDEWISVSLGDYAIDIAQVIIYWEDSYGSQYDIDVSYDGYNWTTVYEERSGNGGEDNIEFDIHPGGKFIRMHGLERATQYGYSIWEISVYGTISEKQPPAVEVNTNKGNVISTGTEVTLIADASDEDGTISSAGFYIDGELISTVNEEPFETTWTMGKNEQYSATIIVSDNDGLSVQSDPYTLYLDDGTMTRFEAEDADWTAPSGQVSIGTSSSTSGGKYLIMNDGWKLIFNNVNVEEAGEYFLTIAYQLTYQSPKTQYLVVNGDTVEAVEFTAQSITDWLKLGMFISLEAGINEIAIYGYWNWMSFDYIGIPGATIVSVEGEDEVPLTYSLSRNYPNPFNPATRIKYSIPEASKVVIKVFDILGREVATLVNKELSAGNYEINFNAEHLSSGVYFYRLQAGDFIATQKMILMK